MNNKPWTNLSGGSFFLEAFYAKTAPKSGAPVDYTNFTIGVRLVRRESSTKQISLRGGSWFRSHLHVRTVYRYSYHPAIRDLIVGIRLVRRGK